MQAWEVGEIRLSDDCLAIIPARGGSKGVPRKCIRRLGSTTLLERCISTAALSRSVSRAVVSTDDQEFADIAAGAGAEIPCLRPPELATDTSSTVDAIDHMLQTLWRREKVLPSHLVLLQLTTPFVQPSDIDRAFSSFAEGVDAVCSVCETEVQPDWLRQVGDDGFLKPLQLDCPQHIPRQQMPVTYRLNGGIYWVRTKVFLRGCSLLPTHTVPYVMPTSRSVDIDSEDDLRLAAWMEENMELGREP